MTPELAEVRRSLAEYESNETAYQASKPGTNWLKHVKDEGERRAEAGVQWGSFELPLNEADYDSAMREFEWLTRWPRSGTPITRPDTDAVQVETASGTCLIVREAKPLDLGLSYEQRIKHVVNP